LITYVGDFDTREYGGKEVKMHDAITTKISRATSGRRNDYVTRELAFENEARPKSD
jgi:hypothetical protein